MATIQSQSGAGNITFGSTVDADSAANNPSAGRNYHGRAVNSMELSEGSQRLSSLTTSAGGTTTIKNDINADTVDSRTPWFSAGT